MAGPAEEEEAPIAAPFFSALEFSPSPAILVLGMDMRFEYGAREVSTSTTTTWLCKIIYLNLNIINERAGSLIPFLSLSLSLSLAAAKK